MTREEFLRSLKPGDRVGVSQRYDSYFASVIRVTTSGQIVVRRILEGGQCHADRRFSASGMLIGAFGSRFHRPHLVPVDEIEQQLAEHKREQRNHQLSNESIDLIYNGQRCGFSPERKAEILALVEQLETTE